MRALILAVLLIVTRLALAADAPPAPTFSAPEMFQLDVTLAGTHAIQALRSCQVHQDCVDLHTAATALKAIAERLNPSLHVTVPPVPEE